MEVDTDRYIFKHPFGAVLCGPSQSGKSTFVSKLIQNIWLLEKKPKAIYWCMGIATDMVLPKDVIKVYGLPTIEDFESFGENTLVVLDDLLSSVAASKKMDDVFTKMVHHNKISVIFLTQNLFEKGLRSITLNAQYIILTRTTRDLRQIKYLFSQVRPNSTTELLSDCADAMKNLDCYPPHFLVNVHPFGNLDIQFQSCIFDDRRVVYRIEKV